MAQNPDPHSLADERNPAQDGKDVRLVRFHLCVGWWGVLVFLTLGGVLEALHGFKVGWYLDVGNETRRLMWTLAHAHGTLLSLVNLAFAGTLRLLPGMKRSQTASHCLLAAVLLMPAGFFVGGLWPYEGDPGLGILLVPPGAALLFIGVCLTAAAATRR